jgi:hypothetical protein
MKEQNYRRYTCNRYGAMVLLSMKSNDNPTNSNEYVANHVSEEYKTFKQTVRPKIGSLVELEWRKMHVHRLSYIVWVANKCKCAVNPAIQQQAIQSLRNVTLSPITCGNVAI